MKKIWHILLLAVCCLCFGLAACGGDNTGDNTSAITLSKETLTLKAGGSATLEATIAEGAEFTAEELTWVSSDADVVSVTGEGATATVTAKAVGTATITVSFGEEKAECAVTVEKSDINPISIFLPEGKLVVKINVTTTVKAISEIPLTGEPVWSSSDTSIGTVESQGLTARVTSLKRGECTITVQCDGYSASFTLVVGIS